MATLLGDRVKETWSGSGTGTMSLGGAVTGFQTFVAGIGSGQQTFYTIDNEAGGWEVGIGVVTGGSPDTLSRVTVLRSSNANALVNFGAGTKKVFNTIPAEYALYGLGERLLDRQLSTTAHHLEYTTLANLLRNDLDELCIYFHGTVASGGDNIKLEFPTGNTLYDQALGVANYMTGWCRITRVSSTEIEWEIWTLINGASTAGTTLGQCNRETGLAALESGGQELKISLTNSSIMRQMDVFYSPAPSALPSPGDVVIGGGGSGSGGNALWLPTPFWHFDAQDDTVLTAGPVVDWTTYFQGDLSPLTVSQATSGSRPTYSGAAGDASAVAFDGTNDHLFSGGSPAGLNHNVGDLWLVITPDALPGGPFSVTATGSAYIQFGTYIRATGELEVYAVPAGAGSVGLTTAAGVITVGNKHVVRIYTDAPGTKIKVEVDGVDQPLTETFGTNTGQWWGIDAAINSVVLGATINSGVAVSFFHGKIHEVIYYGSTATDKRLLSPSHAAWLRGYINGRWGTGI